MSEFVLEGLSWRSRLPLRLLDTTDEALSIGSDMATLFDERLLKVLSAAEEQTGSAWSDDAEVRARQRLEAKVDLLLAAMGWQTQQQDPMPLRDVRLYEHGLEVTLSSAEVAGRAVGDPCAARIQLDAAQPFPLTIPCSVLAVAPTADGDANLALRFGEENPEVLDLMVKFIFRQHRREVASQRRERGDE